MNNSEEKLDEIYTVGMALWWAENALKEVGIPSPGLDAEILLGQAAELTKEEIFFSPDQELSSEKYYLFERLIARRKNFEPIAYITGNKEFFGLNLDVNNNVLVPRPETEDLVESALDTIKKYDGKECTILEIGTGSGAIVLALANSLKNWGEKHNFDFNKFKIIATDISKDCLAVAKENAKKLGLDTSVDFIESDLLENIGEIKKPELLLANLPYLDEEKINSYPADLEHEPGLALFTKDKGLALYKKLFKQLDEYRIAPKKIIIECEGWQAEELKKINNEIEFIEV